MEVGTRIRLLTRMLDDPDPIPKGAEGIVTHYIAKSEIVPWEQLAVAWDDGRRLGLACPPDQYEVIAPPPVHKATPAAEFAEDATSTCVHCHREIRRVPGGQGVTWVHADSGAVAGSGAPS